MTTGRPTAGAKLAVTRLRRASHDRPRLFFTPSPGLLPFWEDDARRQCVLAANRVGKTYHAIAKVAKKVIEAEDEGRVLRLRITAPTNKMMYDTHGRYLELFLRGWLAKGSRWSPAKGFNNGNVAIARGGSTIALNSYEQRVDAMASSALDGVLLDEPPPPGHYEEALARVMSTHGWVWATFTAVNRPVKWFRKIVEDGLKLAPGQTVPDWTFHQVALSHKTCPWYPEEWVQERIREAARQPWSYKQRIEGAWEGVAIDRSFTGYSDRNLLYTTGSESTGQKATGFKQAWPYPGKSVRVVLAVDHGEGAGHSHWILFAYQVVPGSRPSVVIRAIGEWSNPSRMSVKAEAEAVQAMVIGAGLDLGCVSWAIGDTNSAGRSVGARSMNELFEQEFARLMGRNPNQPRFVFRSALKGADTIEPGIARVNQLLDELPDVPGYDLPCLQILDGCSRTVDALCYWSGKDDDLKHPADTLRYGVTSICAEVGVADGRLVAA